jgi:hypothetical protein
LTLSGLGKPLLLHDALPLGHDLLLALSNECLLSPLLLQHPLPLKCLLPSLLLHPLALQLLLAELLLTLDARVNARSHCRSAEQTGLPKFERLKLDCASRLQLSAHFRVLICAGV